MRAHLPAHQNEFQSLGSESLLAGGWGALQASF